jgi:hypothetical protein
MHDIDKICGLSICIHVQQQVLSIPVAHIYLKEEKDNAEES